MINRLKTTYVQRLANVRRNEDGSILIFSLFLFVVMLLVSGLAVDFMRTETKRVQIQSTLDRAILAAASMEQSLDAETVVRDYFDRAELSEYLQDVKVTETDHSKTVTALASAQVSPFFLNMLGFETLPANAAGQAQEGFTDIEVSLILDVSGSMGWTSSVSGNKKIEDLKDAAQEFVYRVMCNPDAANVFADACTIEPNTVSVNLIMYNEQVLVGETLLSMFKVTNEHTFSSCVDFENDDFTKTEIDPNAELQRAGHIDAFSRWYKGFYGWEASYQAKEYWRSCRVDANNEIMPLEEDWQELYDRIELLSAGGYTSIEMGMKWGTALLDPEFRPVTAQLVSRDVSGLGAPSVVSEFSNRPANFGNGGVEKFIVVMTDGENTVSYALQDEYRSGPSEFWVGGTTGPGDPLESFPGSGEVISVFRKSQQNYINPFTGAITPNAVGVNPRQLDFVELWERYGTDFYNNSVNNNQAHNWLPNPVNETNGANKNSNLVHICEQARDEAITIYTLGFETTTASTAVMKKCASSHAHHFDVDGNSIDDAFAAIARDIQKLRLVN